jgi:hypothetical protein
VSIVDRRCICSKSTAGFLLMIETPRAPTRGRLRVRFKTIRQYQQLIRHSRGSGNLGAPCPQQSPPVRARGRRWTPVCTGVTSNTLMPGGSFSERAGLNSALSGAVLLAPLLLRPFEAADRVDPLAERTVDRLDRLAPDIGMTRRGAGTWCLPPDTGSSCRPMQSKTLRRYHRYSLSVN